MLLATAVVVAYFLFTAASSAIQSYQLGQEEARLGDEMGRLEERYHRLSALRDYLNSDEYIEWVARRELGLVRAGEMGIIVLSPPTPLAAEPQEEEQGWQTEQGQQPGRWWEEFIGD